MKKLRTKKKTTSYDDFLHEKLKDFDFAIEYLNSSVSDFTDDDFEVFFNALLLVAKAQGMTNVSQVSGVSRDAIYKIFTKHRNPTFKTFVKTLKALGMSISIVPANA